MKLPNNSLGITDSLQWHQCPKKFWHGLKRFTEGERDRMVAGQYSYPLAFGQALHSCAEFLVQDPHAYIEDIVEVGWSQWSHLLNPESYAELKADVKALVDRTLEAPNLRLVSAEQEMSIPLFIGEPAEGSDEENVWYSYRMKIDALYEDTSSPGHYVIRDFKSYRRQRFQQDVDDDAQFTAYDFGVREILGDKCKDVTIWIDQPKHDGGELFTYRTAVDRQRMKEWLTATIRAVLAADEAWIKDMPILNDYCAWCPLLTNCEVVEKCIDYEKVVLDAQVTYEQTQGETSDKLANYVEIYERAMNARKALKAFTEKISSDLKWMPGIYGDREYVMHEISVSKIPPEKALEVLGPESVKGWPALPQTLIKQFPEHADALNDVKSAAYGYHKLTSRKAGT